MAVLQEVETSYDDEKYETSSEAPTPPRVSQERPAASGKTSGRPECFKSTLQEVLFVFVNAMAVSMSSMTQGVGTVLSTFIARDLNMTTSQIIWINAASGLAAGSFLLLFGRLADLFGRKQIFISSLIVFVAFSIGIGFSSNGITVDVLMGCLGLASAACVPASVGMLSLAYGQPSKRKNIAFAVFSAGNPFGFALGALVGGASTSIASWSVAYWAMAIIFAVITAIALWAVPPDTDEKAAWSRETLKKFDVVGAALTIGGIGLFSAALSLGGEATDGWKSSYVIAFLVVGVVLMIAFVVWELYYPHPLVPMGIWKDSDLSLLMSMLFLGFMGFSVSFFWIALYFQSVLKLSAIMVAVYLLPTAVSGLTVNLVTGSIMHKVSNKLLMTIGALAYTVAFILYALNRYGDSYWAFSFVPQILFVIGGDTEFCLCNIYIVTQLPEEQQSTAGGIMQTLSRLSSTIGFGIATAIYNAVAASPTHTGYYGNNPAEPYAAVFWFAAAVAALSLCLAPFLHIGTQGNAPADAESGRPSRNSLATTTSRLSRHSSISGGTVFG